MSAKCSINGKFLSQRITGPQRYALEIVRALDGLVETGEFELCVPRNADISALDLRNVGVSVVRSLTGIAWEQIELPKRSLAKGTILLNLCNSAPIARPGIVCFDDAYARVIPENFRKGYVLWYRILARAYERRARGLFTISEFSKTELGRFYPRFGSEAAVVPCAWQHMDGIVGDDGVFEREPRIRKGEYYLSIASAAKNKNFGWVVEVAKRNPESVFVIAGGSSNVFSEAGIEERENVLRLGYVGDGELKALMSSCKAFLFPSLYEGFGMPPLEALACGARIVVSDIPVFREVYEGAAIYVDPHDPDVELDRLLNDAPEGKAEDVLGRFSWKRSAEQVLELVSARRVG